MKKKFYYIIYIKKQILGDQFFALTKKAPFPPLTYYYIFVKLSIGILKKIWCDDLFIYRIDLLYIIYRIKQLYILYKNEILYIIYNKYKKYFIRIYCFVYRIL
jgi:hypothetical protein